MAMVKTLEKLVGAELVRGKSNLAALGTLAIASLADTTSTFLAIQTNPNGTELNKLTNGLMSKIGVWPGLLVHEAVELFFFYTLLNGAVYATAHTKINAPKKVAVVGIGTASLLHLEAALNNTIFILNADGSYSFAEKAYVNLTGGVYSHVFGAFDSVYSSLASLAGKLF